MGFFDWVAEKQGNYNDSLRRREVEFKRGVMADALGQVLELDQKRRQATDPQTPLRPTTFEKEDELRMAQQMKLAGIDSQAIANSKIANEKLAMLKRAGADIDNPYALANAGNGLDVSPVRVSGGVAHNRFDTEQPFLAMTDAVRNDGLSKGYQAKIDQMRYDQLAQMFFDPTILDSVKTDALNNKAITQTDRIKVLGKDGSAQYTDGVLTPSGWKYAPAMDSDNQPLRVPASTEDTTLGKNLRLVAETWNIPAEEAMGYLLLSKTKSEGQMRKDLFMKVAGNPMMAGDMEATNQFVDDMMGAMYPETETPSRLPTTQPVNSEPPKEQKQAPPKELIAQAVDAINQGADRAAVLERLNKSGYTIKGLGL